MEEILMKKYVVKADTIGCTHFNPLLNFIPKLMSGSGNVYISLNARKMKSTFQSIQKNLR